MKLKLHVYWYRRLFLDIRSNIELRRILWLGSFLMILDLILAVGLMILAFVLYSLYSDTGISTNQIAYLALSAGFGIALILPLIFIFVPGMRALFYEQTRRDKLAAEEAMRKQRKK